MIYQGIFQSINRIIFVGSLGLILHLTYLHGDKNDNYNDDANDGNYIIFSYLHKFLSLNIFSILSRVTYGTFLTHLTIELLFFICYPAKLYFDFWKLSILSIGIIIISYSVSFVLTLLIESPVVNFMKRYSYTVKKEVN